MTHSVIRLTELRVDPTSPLGYAPTANQLLITGTDENRLGGRVFTTPIVRDVGQPEGSGEAATPEQRAMLRAIAQDGAEDPGLVIERVHGEVTLRADLDTLRWLLAVQGGVISVEAWCPFPSIPEQAPAWHEASIKLLHLRDLFTTLTGDALWTEAPAAPDAGTIGPVVTDWGYCLRMTTEPPPSAAALDVLAQQ